MSKVVNVNLSERLRGKEMKKLLFALTAFAVLMFCAGAVKADLFDDVPPEHWARKEIDELQQRGIVRGFPDGTFKGNKMMTRYELAMVIARLLHYIDEVSGKGGSSNTAIDEEARMKIDRLQKEFGEELRQLGVKLDNLDRRVGDVESEVAQLKEAMAKRPNKDIDVNVKAEAGYFSIPDGYEVANVTQDVGYQWMGELHHRFNVDETFDFDYSLTYAEQNGAVGGSIPGANNESVNPGLGGGSFVTPSSGSFVVDQFKATAHLGNRVLGENTTVTLGRQYFSHGEFGLLGDNGYRSNFGVRLDTDFGNEVARNGGGTDRQFSFYAGLYRLEGRTANLGRMVAPTNPFNINGTANANFTWPTAGAQTLYTGNADDIANVGLVYRHGVGMVPGHSHQFEAGIHYTPNGAGFEQYYGGYVNAELPWFSRRYLNGIRGEVVVLANDINDLDPTRTLWFGQDAQGRAFNAGDYTNASWIGELDLINDGITRVSAAYASIAMLPGLPTFANVDNDPFATWENTGYVNPVDPTHTYQNLSREGKNYFPADFEGFGVTGETTFSNKLFGKVTYYTGKRIDARYDERPDTLKVNFRYPFSRNSVLGLDIIATGGDTTKSGFEDTITMYRGSIMLNF